MQPATEAHPWLPAQPIALLIPAGLAVGLAAAISAYGPRMLVLFALGILLGLTLYWFSFGFTSAYRSLLERRGLRAVQAQLIMLAVATVLFAPVLAEGSWFGREVTGAVAPAGFQVAAGAFLFGIGMQFAGGCGSGTLYAAGGGQLRMALVLAFFCIGSFWASLTMDIWAGLPALEPIALGDRLGWPAAVGLQIAVLAGIYVLLERMGRSAKAVERPERSANAGPIFRRQWPFFAGALILAGLNFLTLIAAGHPWSITWAFALWGAKAATLLGWQPQGDAFWSADFQLRALDSPVLSDVTSVMDIGIILGACAAACVAGGFRLRFAASSRAVLTAVIGGLAMGYGARIAYGCNIGAFFSGIASTSPHGWLWIAAALPGCWVGLKLLSLVGRS